MPEPLDRERLAAEMWLRRMGLPLVVRRSRRHRNLFQRTAPVLGLLLGVYVPTVPLLIFRPEPETISEDDVAGMLAITAWILALPVLFWFFPFVTAKLMRRLPERSARITAVGLYAVVTAAGLWDAQEDYFISLLLPSVLVLCTYLGVGAGVVWAVRRMLAQFKVLGHLSTKALPLLFLVVMFSFFTAEVWELTDPVGGMSTRDLWMTVGFLVLLGVLFLLAVLRHELRELDRNLAQFEEHRPLAWNERLNVSIILFLSQAFQTVLFVMLVFAFFLAFGTLALSPETIESWVKNPTTDGTAFGREVPLSDQLIQISFFLAVFSGLSFTVSTATDPGYRAAFFDPLIEEITESLDFRDAYLARWPDPTAAPPVPPQSPGPRQPAMYPPDLRPGGPPRPGHPQTSDLRGLGGPAGQ